MISSLLFSVLSGLIFYILILMFSSDKKVASFPGSLPIIGNGFVLLRYKDIFSFVKDLGSHSMKHGGISAFKLGWKSHFIITNPEDATIVLSKCLEKMFIYKFIEPLFGAQLVSAEGAVWKQNRRISDQAFKPQIINSYIQEFNEQAVELVDSLNKKVGEGYVDVTEDVTRNVLKTACLSTLGKLPDDGTFVYSKYVKAIHRVFEVVTLRLQKPWLLFDVIFNHSSLKKDQDESVEIIHAVSTKMVQIRKSEYLENKNKTSNKQEIRSFLHILMENSSKDGLSDSDIRCLCDNVLLAAFDTSTYELLFTMICIGSDAAVQDRIYQEIIEVIGDNTTVTREHLAKLVYLEAVIKEALRLYPIGPIVGRDSTDDLQLGRVTLPANSSIIVHLWAINRHKAYWGADAEEFNPGRWLSKDTLPEHPNAFASFSFGRRNCIGKHYAMMYMKTTLALLIRKYRFFADHEKMEFDCYIMLKVKAGHLMKVELR